MSSLSLSVVLGPALPLPIQLVMTRLVDVRIHYLNSNMLCCPNNDIYLAGAGAGAGPSNNTTNN